MKFERILSDAHLQPYIDCYIDEMSLMERANDTRAYRNVAANLAHAASLSGGQARAQEAASSIRAEYPRRRALIDELRSAGFVV